MVATLLIVEDDANIRKLAATYLQRDGYRILEAVDGEDALEVLDREPVDLMVADIMMPRLDGFTLTEQLRGAHYDFPILIMTAKERIEDKQRGFRAGTDDYLVKPIDFDELRLRVAALLRRAKINTERKITLGGLTLDQDSYTVRIDGEEVALPQKEFQLLFRLLSYPGKIFTRQSLMDDIWGYDTESDERTVDVHIKRLRDKFGERPEFSIVTAKGLGYKAVSNL
ncbi:MAG: response regulator transcription factor [Coriobacteriales bacterium]|jgi:DNA-binding response OmpR family regulator|nr:response regulator transcription factor [Coriobacteriales bacterium]